MTFDLTRFKALSFDCYGTLIDWEYGITAVLRPWADEVNLALSDEDLLRAYAANEAQAASEQPNALYPEILAAAFRGTGSSLGRPVSDVWARRLAVSVPDWPAFGDSANALAQLAKHYQLIIVSNVDRAGFEASNRHLRCRFSTVITAEDVGAYKPADKHFAALAEALPALGVEPRQLLHVAQSLFHDHVPAKKHGLASVWINRRQNLPGWGATPEPAAPWRFDAEFPDLAAFAAGVDAQFRAHAGC